MASVSLRDFAEAPMCHRWAGRKTKAFEHLRSVRKIIPSASSQYVISALNGPIALIESTCVGMVRWLDF